MDLIAANPRLITVPTVDIVCSMIDVPLPLSHADDGSQELTWQTHMLKSSYFADMKSQVGRYVDHDAAIEESALAQLFADTTEAWNVRWFRSNWPTVKLTLHSDDRLATTSPTLLAPVRLRAGLFSRTRSCRLSNHASRGPPRQRQPKRRQSIAQPVMRTPARRIHRSFSASPT